MKKSKRLQVLTKLEHMREQKKLFELNTARQEMNRQQALSQQLTEYIQDYSSFNDPGRQATSPYLLGNASRFVDGISQAHKMQVQRCEQTGQQLELSNQQWKQAHARGKAIFKLVRRYQLQEELEQVVLEDRDAEEQWLVSASSQKGG